MLSLFAEPSRCLKNNTTHGMIISSPTPEIETAFPRRMRAGLQSCKAALPAFPSSRALCRDARTRCSEQFADAPDLAPGSTLHTDDSMPARSATRARPGARPGGHGCCTLRSGHGRGALTARARRSTARSACSKTEQR